MPSTTLDFTQAGVMVQARDIRKTFSGTEVLKGVSLDIHKGEVVAVIGPSGSGKSTFLRCLNHLEMIDSGSVVVGGATLVQNNAQGAAQYAPDAELRAILRRMGMVFQSFNLFPHLSVLENIIEAPMIVKGRSRDQIMPKAVARVARRPPATVAQLVALPLLPGQAPSPTAPPPSPVRVRSRPIAVLRVSLSVGSMRAALPASLTGTKPLWMVGNRRLRLTGPLSRMPTVAFLILITSSLLRLHSFLVSL